MAKPSPDDMKDSSFGEIYSPEASDFDPWGDWQTKLAVGVLIALACGVFLYCTQ